MGSGNQRETRKQRDAKRRVARHRRMPQFSPVLDGLRLRPVVRHSDSFLVSHYAVGALRSLRREGALRRLAMSSMHTTAQPPRRPRRYRAARALSCVQHVLSPQHGGVQMVRNCSIGAVVVPFLVGRCSRRRARRRNAIRVVVRSPAHARHSRSGRRASRGRVAVVSAHGKPVATTTTGHALNRAAHSGRKRNVSRARKRHANRDRKRAGHLACNHDRDHTRTGARAVACCGCEMASCHGQRVCECARRSPKRRTHCRRALT